jgi:hypothetical protein
MKKNRHERLYTVKYFYMRFLGKKNYSDEKKTEVARDLSLG